MPSAAKFGRLLEEQHGDDLDDFGLDDSDNPFGSPTPPPESSSKKRKEPDSGLGIEEEVSVQKRVRVPNVKLDEERLMGPAGIPKLRRRAFGLKLKGKGHEFSDASRLLSFYQLWLDDLFPKARFLDALAMVEKAGHKKALVSARSEWINEGRPKAGNDDDDDELDIGAVAITEDSQVTESGLPTQRAQKSPERDDIPDDDDLYGATPRGPARTTNALRPAPSNDAPDDDDLEALMAEAESMDSRQAPAATTKQNSTSDTHHLDEEDDLDALIAEAEVQDRSSGHSAEKSGGNSTSNDKGHDFADEEEAMQEMEGLW
ncbi:Chromosome segregation in meiosis protein 3 [Trichoderma lentiforme]|uniref:Chromosome segregation in meiosis protein n=1 Tax=Trichoderma lentiforme TaxID=1567552 RepID=A0A9P4X9L0_9HYPO|nr:Chromosome segregation in meiosis protein 3 [Trichoderma lentiforme]